MLKKYKKCWFFCIVAIVALIFPILSFSAETSSQDDYTKGLVNEKYKKQSNFVCNKQEFQIPPYFPYGDKFSYNNKPPASDIYLTVRESDCNIDHFYVIVGLGANCMGQNICINSSFEYRNFGKIESSYMDEVLSSYKADVSLDREIKGYFIPSRCWAYCNTAKIIWFDYDKQRIYIISTKNPQNNQEAIDELVKSANSYINIQK